jgi:hypothetical protein
MFTATTNAALHNGNLLSRFQSNFGDVINAHPGSSLSHGSEFRPILQLQLLFNDHPSWPKLLNTLLYGGTYNLLQERCTEDHLADLLHLHDYGNHKSATSPEGITLALSCFNARQCATSTSHTYLTFSHR